MNPNPITLDLDFFMSPRDLRMDVINDIVQERPDLIEQFFDAGWHTEMHKRHIVHSRKFLRCLSQMQDAELASRLVRRFFEGLSPEAVNAHLMEKRPGGEEVVCMHWLSTGIHSAGQSTELITSLLKAAQEMGADFTQEFNFTLYEPNGQSSKSGKHTLMSASMGIDARSKEYVELNMLRLGVLLELGQPLDKSAMGVLVRDMVSERAVSIWNFLKEKQVITATEILKWTARMKQDPETLAVLQAESAKEAMDQMVPVCTHHP